jgi:hypothetical protein
MASNATPPGAPRIEPLEDLTAHFRRAIAARSRRADVLFPEACDLEATVLDAIHREIHGAAPALAGVHSPARWREALRGERGFPLADICRLAVTPGREARQAVQAALQLLQSAVDDHRARAGVTLAGRVSDLAGAAMALLGELARANEDGRLDSFEQLRLSRKLEAVEHSLRDVRALLEGHQKEQGR